MDQWLRAWLTRTTRIRVGLLEQTPPLVQMCGFRGKGLLQRAQWVCRRVPQRWCSHEVRVVPAGLPVSASPHSLAIVTLLSGTAVPCWAR